MPAPNHFPRVISRGPLRGRKFDTQSEYTAAIQEHHRKRHLKEDAYKFTLRLVFGSLEVEIVGDPRKPEDVDRVLTLFGEYGAK